MDNKSEGSARKSVARRWMLGCAVVGLVVLAWVSGCASGRTLQSEAGKPWLDATGFPERATWPSRLLHLDRRRMPRSARLSSLVDQAPGIVVGQPQGESWGVQRALPDGPRCDVAVYLNGVEIRRKHAGGDWTLDFLVLLRDLDGVEIHVGPNGPLMDDSGCGVLLLWSEAAAQGVSASFHGSIEGIYWGTREADVVEVALDGSDQRAELTGGGTFVFREVLPGLREVLIRTARETVGRDTVRVYAFARSAMDIPIR